MPCATVNGHPHAVRQWVFRIPAPFAKLCSTPDVHFVQAFAGPNRHGAMSRGVSMSSVSVRGSSRVSVRVLLAAGLACAGLAGCGEDEATSPMPAGPALSEATVNALATEVRQLT